MLTFEHVLGSRGTVTIYWTDYCTINGFQSPGICDVKGGAEEFDWERTKGNATTGATAKLKGRNEAKASLDFTLKTDELDDWLLFILNIRYDLKKPPKAYYVSHPQLQVIPDLIGWSIDKIQHPEPLSPGLWKASIELVEYKEPKVNIQLLKGSSHPSEKKPETEQDKIIAALTKRQGEANEELRKANEKLLEASVSGAANKAAPNVRGLQ